MTCGCCVMGSRSYARGNLWSTNLVVRCWGSTGERESGWPPTCESVESPRAVAGSLGRSVISPDGRGLTSRSQFGWCLIKVVPTLKADEKPGGSLGMRYFTRSVPLGGGAVSVGVGVGVGVGAAGVVGEGEVEAEVEEEEEEGRGGRGEGGVVFLFLSPC